MTPYPRIKGKVLYDGFIEIFMCQGFEFSYKFLKQKNWYHINTVMPLNKLIEDKHLKKYDSHVYKEGKFVRRIIK